MFQLAASASHEPCLHLRLLLLRIAGCASCEISTGNFWDCYWRIVYWPDGKGGCKFVPLP